jgi:phage tail sheath protein FI
MVQVSYPGVYVIEVPSGVHTITGVSTSIAAFFGRTTKGPLDRAVRCLSLSDFYRTFGQKANPQSELSTSVRMFFANGGTDCYVIRLAAGALPAAVTLKNLAGTSVLTATAKSAGLWGNGVRLEISYNTPQPDETFTLTVIEEDGGVEVARETHTGLTMDPNAPRFAPAFVTQSSDLIDLALHTDANLNASGVNGYSQSRVFKRTPLNTFRPEFEALLTSSPRFDVNVDDTQWVSIDLSTVLGPDLPPNWNPDQMASRITVVINEHLNAISLALIVEVSWVPSGDYGVFRIASATGDAKSVRIRRGSTQDFAVPAMLGIDQGGIEPVRFSDLRPVPTGSFFTDVNDVLALAVLGRDNITSVAVDGLAPVTFSFAAMTPDPQDRWFIDSAGTSEGVREKLRAIADAVNGAGIPWRAEVWGYHLAVIARGGSINETPASIESKTSTTLGGANFARNVRRYTLGSTGTSTFQLPGAPGTDGGPFTLNEFRGSPLTHTGVHALDKVDLFNLMVIPADEDVPAGVHQTLWGPASVYCEEHRAFLLIDAPPDWVANGVPTVVNNPSLLDNLRAGVTNDHSAVYFPRLRYSDGGVVRAIGPAGAIAGLMARTDSTRGVWKAPAGVEAGIRAIVDIDVILTDGENGVLNKQGVNCIRRFPSGFTVWGARTLDGADDGASQWKYVPVRRFALFLEESLFRGTKWVVFEPNDEPLWAQIRMNLSAFMMGLFRQGAFQGSTPEKAFYVKCDGETTTANDRNLGIVNIEVGFAPLKPAEFVVIKIQQIADVPRA